MAYRRMLEVLALAAVLMATADGARAQDKAYPSWRGEWGVNAPRLPGQQLRYDPSKPFGKGQEAPLTAEYQKIYEDNLAELAQGRQGLFLYHASCLPAGMPSMMSAGTFEFIVTPETTYIVADSDIRRIFTDGRPWPAESAPTYQGYSIGKWLDQDGTGVYDVLEVETHGPFKGPRTYDASGLPLAFDNELTFKERLFLDKKDPEHSARCDDRVRSRPDAAVDRRQELPAPQRSNIRTGTGSAAWRAPPTSPSARNITW